MSARELVRAVQQYLDAEHDAAALAVMSDRPATAAKRLRRAHEALARALRESAAAGRGPIPLRRVLVAIDRTPPAQMALRFGTELAGLVGAELGLVHVVERPAAAEAHDGPAIGDDADALLRNAAASVHGVAVTGVFLRTGAAANAILAAAREWVADLIVLGTNEHGRFSQLFYPSTAAEVTRHASCPVLVIRAAATASRAPDDECVDDDAAAAGPFDDAAAAAAAVDAMGRELVAVGAAAAADEYEQEWQNASASPVGGCPAD